MDKESGRVGIKYHPGLYLCAETSTLKIKVQILLITFLSRDFLKEIESILNAEVTSPMSFSLHWWEHTSYYHRN